MTSISTSARDPVCGMSVDPAVAKYTHVHQGTTWYFCADNCRQQFMADPSRFTALPSANQLQKKQRASLAREIPIALAVFVGVVAVAIAVRGFTKPAATSALNPMAVGRAAGTDKAIDNGQGGVITEATFERKSSSDKVLTFSITIDTHTVDLSSFDPARQVRLISGPSSFAPQTADRFGENSKHHQNYRLTFPAIPPGEMSLDIKGVGGVERALPFRL